MESLDRLGFSSSFRSPSRETYPPLSAAGGTEHVALSRTSVERLYPWLQGSPRLRTILLLGGHNNVAAKVKGPVPRATSDPLAARFGRSVADRLQPLSGPNIRGEILHTMAQRGREKKGGEKEKTQQASPPEPGGRGRARAPVTSRCTPRSQRHADATVPHLQLTRDAARRVCASLAPAHRILTPLRAPGTLGQLVTLLLSLRLRARTGPLLRPPRRPRWQHATILSLSPLRSCLLLAWPSSPCFSSSTRRGRAVGLLSLRFRPSFPPRFLS